MQHQKLLIAIAIIAVVIIVGSVGALMLNDNSSGINLQPSPTPTPELSVQEQTRDAAVAYIQTNHAETGQYLANVSWTGGRQDNAGMVGSDTYIYNSTNWAITISYPIVYNPIFTVNATYSQSSTTIIWDGTYVNSTITETNYAFSP